MTATPLELIDAHTHTQPSAAATHEFLSWSQLPISERTGDVDELLAKMDRGGVSRTVIVSWVPVRALVDQAVAGGVDRGQAEAEIVQRWRELNAWVTASAREHPDRLSAYIGLEPALMGEDVVRAEAAAHLGHGAMGLKVAPYSLWMHADDPRLEIVWRLAREYDVPVLSESGAHPEPAGEWGHPRYFHEVLRSYPELRLQLAHLGAGAEDEMGRLLRAFPQVVTDTAMRLDPDFSPDYTPHQLAELIRQLGVDQVLFGTNYPIVDQVGYANELRALPMTADELRRIGHDNAARFFRLD